jgi:hypothetical protein
MTVNYGDINYAITVTVHLTRSNYGDSALNNAHRRFSGGAGANPAPAPPTAPARD